MSLLASLIEVSGGEYSYSFCSKDSALLEQVGVVIGCFQNLTKRQPVEIPALAPSLNIAEIGLRPGGIADEIARFLGRLAFIVVLAGSAIGGAQHAGGAGEEEVQPDLLGLGGDLDLARALLLGMGDDGGDRAARFDEIVRDVRDQVGALDRLDEEQFGEAVDVDAALRFHPAFPGAAGDLQAVTALEGRADLEARGIDDAVHRIFLTGGDETLDGDTAPPPGPLL